MVQPRATLRRATSTQHCRGSGLEHIHHHQGHARRPKVTSHNNDTRGKYYGRRAISSDRQVTMRMVEGPASKGSAGKLDRSENSIQVLAAHGNHTTIDRADHCTGCGARCIQSGPVGKLEALLVCYLNTGQRCRRRLASNHSNAPVRPRTRSKNVDKKTGIVSQHLSEHERGNGNLAASQYHEYEQLCREVLRLVATGASPKEVRNCRRPLVRIPKEHFAKIISLLSLGE